MGFYEWFSEKVLDFFLNALLILLMVMLAIMTMLLALGLVEAINWIVG